MVCRLFDAQVGERAPEAGALGGPVEEHRARAARHQRLVRHAVDGRDRVERVVPEVEQRAVEHSAERKHAEGALVIVALLVGRHDAELCAP
eukprot:182413-Prymnesium_polylepis.1